MLARPAWHAQAACKDVSNPEVFFPKRGASSIEVRAVRELCASCPVQQECLEYSLDEKITHGIWGGVSERERRQLRRERRQPGRQRRRRRSAA